MSVFDESIVTKTISLASAIVFGERVSDERLKERIKICSECPKSEVNSEGLMNCGICGCALKGDRSLVNLALYEETDKYGCKAPGGSRWKAADV